MKVNSNVELLMGEVSLHFQMVESNKSNNFLDIVDKYNKVWCMDKAWWLGQILVISKGNSEIIILKVMVVIQI